MSIMSEQRYTGFGSRRSHRKSRLGCANCKRRRIKCDETRPGCSQCAKHALPCNYPDIAQTTVSGQASPTPSSAVTEEDYHVEWGPITAELMHHWSTLTSYSLSDDHALQTFLRVNAPRIAFENEHVLHIILSISAMHLARLRPSRESFYSEHADRHYHAGLRMTIDILPNLNQENCHSIFLFATLCNGYSLAKGPKPGEFLLFSETGSAEWNGLLRGIIPVLQAHGMALLNGPLAPLLRGGVSAALRAATAIPSPEHEQLTHLHDNIQSSSILPDDLSIVEVAMDHLRALFSSRYSTDDQKSKATFQQIGIWLYRCNDEFSVLLQKRHPAALAIYAHACVVLNEVSGMWAMSGWVPHLLEGIYNSLPQQFRHWMQWPVEQIGWIPP